MLGTGVGCKDLEACVPIALRLAVRVSAVRRREEGLLEDGRAAVSVDITKGVLRDTLAMEERGGAAIGRDSEKRGRALLEAGRDPVLCRGIDGSHIDDCRCEEVRRRGSSAVGAIGGGLGKETERRLDSDE